MSGSLVTFILLSTLKVIHTSSISASTENSCAFLVDYVYHGVLAECSNRNLKEVPKNFLPNTTSVDLSNNNIVVLKDKTFTLLKQLKSLILKNNSLAYLEPLSFDGCSRLQQLDLSQNKLELTNISYLNSVFDSLHSLQWLNLKKNHPGYGGPYPDRIFRELKRLEFLNIDVFGEPHFGHGMGGLSNLKELVIGPPDECYMDTIRNSTFLPLANTSLEVLDISYCKFTIFETGTFAPLTKLQELIAMFIDVESKNALQSLSGFVGRTMRIINLWKIYASMDPSVTSVTTAILDSHDLQYLTHICVEKFIIAHSGLLYIDFNSLLTTTFSRCINHLDISMNRLHPGITDFFTLFHGFTNLTYIDVSFQENGMRPFPMVSRSVKHFLPTTTYCQSTSLSNFFSERSNITHSFLNKLIYLNISSMATNAGKIYGHIQLASDKLLEANVSFNGINQIHGTISGLVNLSSLDMSGNPELVILDSFFDTFPSIKSLHMNYMSLRQEALFKQGKRLMQSLPKLETLHLTNNHLSDLPNDLFSKNILLKYIDLSGNVFMSIPFNLKNTPNLNILDMKLNSIGFLDKPAMEKLDEHSESLNNEFQLFLDGNAFRCDCQSLNFLFWLKETRTSIDRDRNFTCILESGFLSDTAEEMAKSNHLWRKCIGYNLFYISSSGLVLMIAFLLLVLLVKTNRTVIRCMIENLIRQELPKPQRRDFKYDLYIAYADQDYRWACLSLCPALEERKMTLFLWDRDSIPGDSVPDQIAENMTHSWKILLNFTVNFDTDAWTYMSMMAAINNVDNYSPEKVILLLPRDEQPQIPNCLLDLIPESCIIRFSPERDNIDDLCDTITAIIIKEI